MFHKHQWIEGVSILTGKKIRTCWGCGKKQEKRSFSFWVSLFFPRIPPKSPTEKQVQERKAEIIKRITGWRTK